MVPQSQDPVHSLRVTLKRLKRPNIKHQTYKKIEPNNCKSQLHQVYWGIIRQLVCLSIDDQQIGFGTEPNY